MNMILWQFKVLIIKLIELLLKTTNHYPNLNYQQFQNSFKNDLIMKTVVVFL